MIEKIKEFNLELALFVKELHSYTETVNETDDETTKLLIETILAVDKLQASSKNRETSSANENQFVYDLDEGIFKVRRCIVCRLCHDHISLDAEDFELHIQKKRHKEREAELKLSRQSPNGSDIAQVETNQSKNNAQCDVQSDQVVKLKAAHSLVISLNCNGNQSVVRANSQEMIGRASVLSNPVKLDDVIKMDKVSQAIAAQIIDFVSRTTTRTHNETQILKSFVGYLNEFDSKVQLSPFGSATYGYGGSNTNFNILANAGDSDKSPISLLNSFEKYLKTTCVQNDFEILDTIAGNRSQKRRLQLIHKKSRILCWLQFGFDCELAKTSQIIRDCINREPICYHLIAYIKGVQSGLNKYLVENGIENFHFNTYIISILVIFFLQVNYNFPKLKDLSSSRTQSINAPPAIDKESFGKAIVDFFNFYGKKYEVAKDLMSLNIGRLQKRRLDAQQTKHTPEQKSLRDAIEANLGNWENCTMYIEDIKSPAINVAAEIPEKEARCFKKLCQTLATFSHKKIIDAYVSKLSLLQATSKNNGSNLNLCISTPVEVASRKSSLMSKSSLESLKSAVKSAGKEERDDSSKPSTSKNCESVNNPIRISSDASFLNPVKLEDVIKMDKVSRSIAAQMIDFASRTKTRIHNETQILKILISHLNEFDSKVQISPFGSATYGFGGSNTNFNVLAGGFDKHPFNFLNSLEKYLKTTCIQNDFEIVGCIAGNRSQKRLLQLIHKNSRVMCCLHCASNYELADTSQVIRDCINREPICYHLIAYIKGVQSGLNKYLVENGIENFNFNTYIISILVIFFLQVNYNFPKLKDLSSSRTQSINAPPAIDKESFGKAIVDFFNFYGKKYEVAKDLMSLNIGRLQKRKLDAQQTKHTPEQKSLRDAIEANLGNWENCTMYIEDIKSPAINVAAEIPEKEARYFKKLCQTLATFSHKEIIDEYVSKLSLLQAGKKTNSSSWSLDNAITANASNSKTNDSSVFALQNIRAAIVEVENGIPRTSMPKTLENSIRTGYVLKLARSEMMDLLSRSEKRIRDEKEIADNLAYYFYTIDSTAEIVPFGSATNGFGGLRTNFNILAVSGVKKSNFVGILDRLEVQMFDRNENRKLTPDELLQKFENSFKNSSRLNSEFELLGKTKASRAQGNQLKILHRKFRISCIVHFEDTITIKRSSQIIDNYTTLSPICKDLIAYVKALLNVLNDIATQNGLPNLQFNGYIISVLVIFYLQLKHNFPTINGLQSVSDKALLLTKESLSKLIKEFFKFYGCTYELPTHLISLNVGRWQGKRLQKEQKNFSPEQKRLRDGIARSPANWTNSAMWVEDLVRPDVNITAEISNDDANNFVELCQMFYSNASIFDEVNATKPTPTANLNQNADIFSLVEKEISDMSQPSFLESRRRSEVEMISILTKYIKQFNTSLDVLVFGSSHYGIKESNTNLNLLINTRGERPKEVSQRFYLFKLEKTDSTHDFKQISIVNADRVLKRQIHLVHIKTGIKCSLLFESDSTIVESSEIISRFVNKEPMCRFLITYIRAWQNVLNKLGIAKFEFNTYIISVLVIFFLQTSYKLPKVGNFLDTGSSWSANFTNFKMLPQQFFAFYGNSYQMWNHVISAHIGRWQERRIQSEQKNFTEFQQRLRRGIETTPENWANCHMYVQDLVRPDVNITAEISKEAAENFQLLCKKFAKKAPTT